MNDFQPRQHKARFLSPDGGREAHETFTARNVPQAFAFARKRAPQGCASIVITAPDGGEWVEALRPVIEPVHGAGFLSVGGVPAR